MVTVPIKIENARDKISLRVLVELSGLLENESTLPAVLVLKD